MATRITQDIIESYLSCKYKGHLKLAGEGGTMSDYEAITAATRATSREATLDKLVARFGKGDACRGVSVTTATLRKGAPLLADADFEDDAMSFRFDALKRVDGTSKLGDHHYLPILHQHGDKVSRHLKLLLAVFGLGLARVQVLRPAVGLIVRGPEARLGKVHLDAKLYRHAEQILDEVKRIPVGGEPPRLVLNDHCPMCEFRRRCHEQAVKEDSLRLLRGLREKEIRGYARKGILTLTQLAHTFRPRRRNKRAVQQMKRHHALQAMAIRDKRAYVFGTPELPTSTVTIYLDMEGLPDEGFVYLIGMIVVHRGTETRHSFWADSKEQEGEMFERFLAETSRYGDFVVFSYGRFERTFLKRMKKTASRFEQVDRILDALVNLLSVVYAHLYFPCHSNGLKDVAGCLGCSWSAADASGLQSIVWRKRWEAGHAEEDVAGCLGCSWSAADASGLQSIVWRKRYFQTAVEALCTYMLAASDRMKAAQLWAGVEALFGRRFGEVGYRLRVLTAMLIEDRGPQRRQHYQRFKKLYDTRSDVVHGGKVKPAQLAAHLKELRSKVFPTTAFGYRKVTIERPLRLNFQASPERVARVEEARAFQNLAVSRKKDAKERAAEEAAGRKQQKAIRDLLKALPGKLVKDRAEFVPLLDAAVKKAGVRLTAPVHRAILDALSDRDETAATCYDDGNPEPDSDLRDTENVPLGEDVQAFFEREVKPHVPDAWVNETVRDDKDGGVGVVGYEINFNRYFYRYQPPRKLEEIEADIKAVEADVLKLLKEVAG